MQPTGYSTATDDLAISWARSAQNMLAYHMIIDFFEIDTKNLFRGLTEYQKKMELQLPAIVESARQEIDNWAKNESIDYGEYEAVLDGHRWTYGYFFPRSLRYSFIVLLFLAVENQLNLF